MSTARAPRAPSRPRGSPRRGRRRRPSPRNAAQRAPTPRARDRRRVRGGPCGYHDAPPRRRPFPRARHPNLFGRGRRHTFGTEPCHPRSPSTATVGTPLGGGGLGWVPPRRKGSAAQLLAQAVVHDLRVRLAARVLHHLSDKEAEQPLLAAAVIRDLLLVRAEDPVDYGVELVHVRDRRLRQIALGREA